MRGQVELDSGIKDPSTAWFDGIWAASFRLKNVFDRVNKQPDESRKTWPDRGIRRRVWILGGKWFG